MKWVKRLIHRDAYVTAVKEIWAAIQAGIEASRDGVVTEEEAKDVGQKVIIAAYRIKDLL
jgi:hypothetical protein